MKKIIIVIFAMVLIFTACTRVDLKDPVTDTSEPSASLESEHVEIVGIADVLSSLDNENITVIKNDDGSMTYKIPKATHKKIMENMRKEFQEMSENQGGVFYAKEASDNIAGDEEDYDFFDMVANLADEASDIGYYNVTVTYNDDGSMNYKIPKATHEEILEDMKKEFDKIIEEMKDTSIIDVENDESFKEITIIVDKEKYRKALDGFKIYSLGFTSMYYQSLDGVDREDMKVTMYLKDQKTGEIFDTIIYPDKFKKFVENCRELADGVVEFAKDTAEIFTSNDD